MAFDAGFLNVLDEYDDCNKANILDAKYEATEVDTVVVKADAVDVVRIIPNTIRIPILPTGPLPRLLF